MLYVYALLSDLPEALPEGLRPVDCGGVTAVVRDVTEAPVPDPTNLASQDSVVRELWRANPAVLPTRFGQVSDGDDALRSALLPRLGSLRAALRQVSGASQMTLRIWGDDPAALGALEPPPPPTGGPGRQYLSVRVHAARAAQALPALEPLEARVADLVRARRVKRSRGPALLATLYHLVTDPTRYREMIVPALGLIRRLSLTLSGPGPAYAFAGGLI